MTRVLHVSDYDVMGGAEVVFQNTVASSRRLGYECEVALADDRRNPVSYIWSRQNAQTFLAVLRNFRPDIVHLQNFYHLWSPSILGAISEYRESGGSLRVVMTAHDFHLICPNSGMVTFGSAGIRPAGRTNFRRLLTERYDRRSRVHSVLKKAQFAFSYMMHDYQAQIDLILSPSQFLISMFEDFGVTTPMEMVRNPIALESLPDASGPREGVVYFGRLTAEKGIVAAAAELDRAGIGLDVYGDGEARQEVIELSDGSRNIRVHGHLDHRAMVQELQRFSVMIVPSVALENAPLTVIEAASQGVKAVCVQGSGAAEMAGLTASFAVYDPARSGALTRAVRRALAEPLINRVVDASLFSQLTYEERLDGVYRRLIAA